MILIKNNNCMKNKPLQKVVFSKIYSNSKVKKMMNQYKINKISFQKMNIMIN